MRLADMPGILVEIELRLSVSRVQLQPLRHCERRAVDVRDSHEREVGVGDRLALVERTRGHEDFLDARVKLFRFLVVACPVVESPHPNNLFLRFHTVSFVFPQIRPGYYFAASSFVKLRRAFYVLKFKAQKARLW